MRKSVTYLMSMKADVADRQREIHELSIDLETVLSNVANITTEEVRFESNIEDLIKESKQINHEIRNRFKFLENAIVRLQNEFGYKPTKK